MIFNSVTFLVFLGLIVSAYWILPNRPRLLLLFIGSLTFYGFWRVEFLPLMLLSTIVDYFIALRMPDSTASRKKKLLITSLVLNLGLLFVFKYLIFFTDNLYGFAVLLGIDVDPIVLKIILPLGISFYTFQTISYTVDVYRGITKPEPDFVLYATYVTFFPQLVAGPILRAREVITQLAHRPQFSATDLAIGTKRVIYGLFLKVVLADNIAPLVDQGFSLPVDALGGLDVWPLAFLFGFQIYFDFSAYSHIALGCARMMGIVFPENFNYPYMASSARDFWKGWHISLSSWIRDYLYLPLSGVSLRQDGDAMRGSTGGLASVVTDSRKDRSLFLTWALMGLWHGANWTFVCWGLYHSAIIYLYRQFSGVGALVHERLRPVLGWMVTLPIMMLGWIPFRADDLETTFKMWGKVLDLTTYGTLGMRENIYLVTALMLAFVVIAHTVETRLVPRLEKLPTIRLVCETGIFAVAIPLVVIFLRPINQFIYFQF